MQRINLYVESTTILKTDTIILQLENPIAWMSTNTSHTKSYRESFGKFTQLQYEAIQIECVKSRRQIESDLEERSHCQEPEEN